jgi:hypothetical protein
MNKLLSLQKRSPLPRALLAASRQRHGAGNLRVHLPAASSQIRAKSTQFPSSKSWVPVDEDALQSVTTKALTHEVSMSIVNSAATTVPWFLKEMPVRHLRHTRNMHLLLLFMVRALMKKM